MTSVCHRILWHLDPSLFYFSPIKHCSRTADPQAWCLPVKSCFSLHRSCQYPVLSSFVQTANNDQKSSKIKEMQAKTENIDISSWIRWSWLACTATMIAYLTCITFVRYLRCIACLNGSSQQSYFAEPNWWHGHLKRYLLDSPLFRTRHHREFKLSSAINMGTLPSRLQTIYLVAYLSINFIFPVMFIDFSSEGKDAAVQLRNHFGVLCIMNMLPLFLLAGRNNPLTKATSISFDTFNLVHRWIGRIVILQALGHTISWLVPKVQANGWKASVAASTHNQFMLWGTIVSRLGTCYHAFMADIIRELSLSLLLWYRLQVQSAMPSTRYSSTSMSYLQPLALLVSGSTAEITTSTSSRLSRSFLLFGLWSVSFACTGF